MNQAYNNNHRFIPYGRQWIDEEDIQAVVDVLRSDWLTTGPKVSEFERAVADYVGAKYAVAVSSGTAALHAAMNAIGVKHGDQVILPPITFAATANCIVYQGATPVFADVDPDTLLINPAEVESKITEHTKAIIAVDYAGQPCDYNALSKIAKRHGVVLVADACHSIGAQYNGRNVGTLAGLTVFSFHPVKHITTGEGGMVVMDEPKFAEKMRRFRNHGITSDHHQRRSQVSWFYEMADLGFNYRITDFQCALGLSQLRKLPKLLASRRRIAERYDSGFKGIPGIKPLTWKKERLHAYHLYVVSIDSIEARIDRNDLYRNLSSHGIGANVHYIPVYLHPFYRKLFGTKSGMCPNAEKAFEQIISLPIHSAMTDDDVQKVIDQVRWAVSKF
jgi:perosamine synthetase